MKAITDTKMGFAGFERPYRAKKNDTRWVTVTVAAYHHLPHMIFKLNNQLRVCDVRYYHLKDTTTEDIRNGAGLWHVIIEGKASADHVIALQKVIDAIETIDV